MKCTHLHAPHRTKNEWTYRSRKFHTLKLPHHTRARNQTLAATVSPSSKHDPPGGINDGEFAMKKSLLACAFALAFTGAAFAQTVSTEYYVVHDPATKKCTIVDKKPTSTTTTVVSNGVFKTRTEAETGMKSIKVCTSN
jgi:hypothetical protein